MDTSPNREVIVKLPFSPWGGWFFLATKYSVWSDLLEAYVDDVDYELESEDGEVLVLNLYECVMQGEIIETSDTATRDIFVELHDDKMFEILCNEATENGWSNRWFLESREVFDAICKYNDGNISIYAQAINKNRLFTRIFGRLFVITQEYDEGDDVCNYFMELDGEETTADDETFFKVLDEFLGKIVPRLRQAEVGDAPTFGDIVQDADEPDTVTPNLLKRLTDSDVDNE